MTKASGAETRDETRWVEAARRGDRGAFERLYEQVPLSRRFWPGPASATG